MSHRMLTQGVFLAAIAGLGAGCNGLTLEDLLDQSVYFVKLDSQPAEVVGLAEVLAVELGFQPIHIYDAASEGFSIQLPRKLASEIEQWNEIEYVLEAPEENYRPPEEVPTEVDDPTIVIGDDEIPPSLVRIGGVYTGPGLGAVHVAVIDTGVEASHPDLNVIAEFDAVGERTGQYANGRDVNGHGTHVAGTIAAYGDRKGVVGVAPGAPIHAVRVLDNQGSGSFTDIIAGIEYVMKNPSIRVANLSLGGQGSPNDANDPLRVALQRAEDAGVVMVIAAGNSEANTNGFVPAGYDVGVVVSAYDADGGDNGWAWFSNYGSAVDIAAPGTAVLSTYPGGKYAELDGTSMASPAVAGVAAAYIAANPSATPAQVRERLISTGENGMQGQNNRHPEPLVNFTRMMR